MSLENIVLLVLLLGTFSIGVIAGFLLNVVYWHFRSEIYEVDSLVSDVS